MHVSGAAERRPASRLASSFTAYPELRWDMACMSVADTYRMEVMGFLLIATTAALWWQRAFRKGVLMQNHEPEKTEAKQV